MSTVYERVVGDQVVERVQPVPGDFEDTRLGVAVLEGTDGWRIADQDQPTEPEAPATPAAEPAIPSPAEPADEPDTAAPARPATEREEK